MFSSGQNDENESPNFDEFFSETTLEVDWNIRNDVLMDAYALADKEIICAGKSADYESLG
jgi:hypothetical protein